MVFIRLSRLRQVTGNLGPVFFFFNTNAVICGLSLLVLYSALIGFFPGTPVFPSPRKPTFDLICVKFTVSPISAPALEGYKSSFPFHSRSEMANVKVRSPNFRQLAFQQIYKTQKNSFISRDRHGLVPKNTPAKFQNP